jgi:hypothetical protein
MKNASKTNKAPLLSISESIRRYGAEKYVSTARRRGEKTFSINAGAVHKALKLNNLVPSVCNALGSGKFLEENRLRLISKTGPPSGKSTTVTFTYELMDRDQQTSKDEQLEAWLKLRGIAKDIFASFGGGEAYLRQERANFYGPGQDPLDRKP